MTDEYHHRLAERDGMEMGIRYPNCGTYASFGDIFAIGTCRNGWKGCRTGLRLDPVVVE